jgi:hypothetical protein
MSPPCYAWRLQSGTVALCTHINLANAGATRNYEIWNDRRGEEEEADEADDAMKALEARTEVADPQRAPVLDGARRRAGRLPAHHVLSCALCWQNSKLEMDILDALDDTKAMNKRKLNVDTSKIIGKMRDSKEALTKESIELDGEEEDLVEQTEFAGSSRRIGEEEEEVLRAPCSLRPPRLGSGKTGLVNVHAARELK